MPTDVSTLKAKADAGDNDAAFAIFDAYDDATKNTDAAWDLALHYLTLAAENEHPDALLAMGRLLIAGVQIDKDVEQGMALLQRAKDLGNQNADDVAVELEVTLDEANHDDTGHDTDDSEADDKAYPEDIDNPDIATSDTDDSQTASEPEKAAKKPNPRPKIGTANDALTADQLLRIIKTKLSQLEKNEVMSAAHHFDILKITIDDSENTKELLAIYKALDNQAYVKTLQEQNQPIIGWNSKQGIFYLDTSESNDETTDEVPLPRRSYQRGEVRNLIFAVFITIVVLIIFLNLLYAVRPL